MAMGGDWRPREVAGFGPRPGRAPAELLAQGVAAGSSHTLVLLRGDAPGAGARPAAAAGALLCDEAPEAEEERAEEGAGEGAEDGREWDETEWAVAAGGQDSGELEPVEEGETLVVPPLWVSPDGFTPDASALDGALLPQTRVTPAMRRRAGGRELGPLPLQPTGEKWLMPLARVMFDERGENPWVQRLPSAQTVRAGHDEPRIAWRNISVEEAAAFQLPFPQQYRDGYGTPAPPPEARQALLEAARALYARHGAPAPGAAAALGAALEEELRAGERREGERAAALAADDCRSALARGNVAQARVWARKVRQALKVAGREEEGRRASNVLLHEANAAERAAEERAREAYIAEEEAREGLVLNRRTLAWERRSRLADPIDPAEVERLPPGHLRLELRVGEDGVADVAELEALLRRTLGDPGAAVTTREADGSPVRLEPGFVAATAAGADAGEEGMERLPPEALEDECEGNALEVASASWERFQQQGGEACGALRVETVNPRLGGLGGEQVLAVRGYGFARRAAWELRFEPPPPAPPVAVPATWLSHRILALRAPPAPAGPAGPLAGPLRLRLLRCRARLRLPRGLPRLPPRHARRGC